VRTRILFALLLVVTGLGAQPGSLERVRALEKERVELAARLAPTVCAVFRGRGGGSGVVITKDGLVLSNFHVTGLDTEMRIGLSDQRIHMAVVLGVDPSGDLSLLRLKEDREWKFTPLGDSDALKQGDWVYAMGNPFLLATDFTPTITLGVVSGIHRYQPGSMRGQLLYPDCIQVDASINPGNSGGPLFNFKQEVVGINGRVSLRDRGRVNIGVGYAISSNQIKQCLPELRAGKIVQHGTLNATVRDLEDPDWPGGVRVTFDKMLEPGAANSAGIRLGDALVSFMGQPVSETNDFLRRISVLPMGRRVHLRVASYHEEGWKERDVEAVLDGIPLIRKSDAAKRKTPQVYIDHEIDRTFSAAREALGPVGAEVRQGTLLVTGRDPRPWAEHFDADGNVTWKLGDTVRTALAAGGGTDGGEPIDEELRADMLERLSAWNDIMGPKAREGFQTVEFTGGALVGGVTVDRFEVETRGGEKRVYFIELDTGRLLRVDTYSQRWVRWLTLLFDDWRTANGLQRPYETTVIDRDKDRVLQTITYKSVQKS
jgi:S1-C subfamily serine protease